MRVNTQAIHFTADAKLLMFVNRKMSKLEQFFDRIIDANVALKLENSGQIKDKIAEIKLSLPGGMIVVKETSRTFEAAIDLAMSAVKRQLMRHKERSDTPLKGKISDLILE
jgi:putative sigma-54 modulation protein